MKAIKYVLAGALLLGSVAPTMAQQNEKAIIDHVSQVIKNKGADFEKQVNQLYKENKKDAQALLAIAKAFYNAKDLDHAIQFADHALARDRKLAKAYILKGDIAVSKDDAGTAAENYEQAKYFDPQDPEGYYKYAMILRGRSPEDAVRNLEELRKQRPDYPVDALAGRIYYFAQNYQKAVEYFDKIQDISKMEDEDLTKYAMSDWLLGKRDKSIEIAKLGLQRDPRRAGWNRIVFYNYTDKKDYPQALEYADRLFNKSDSAHFIAEDYTYYGTALQGAGRYDDAIAAFTQALDMNKDNKVQTGIINKNLSELYLKKGDYDNAVAYLTKSIDAKEKKTMDDYDNLGTLYTDIAASKIKAGDTVGANEAFKQADGVFAKMIEEFPNYKNYGNYMRAQVNANLDPDSKKGLALPFYEELANSLESKADRAASETEMLKQAYFYLMVYQFNVKKDKVNAKNYAAKLLQIDPENEAAKQIQKL